MLFGRKKNGKNPEPATPEVAEASNEIPADRALDLVAEVLRILGEHAFDVGSRSAVEIAEHFETWARHLLIGVPPPEAEGQDTLATDEPGSERDLPGLRRAVQDHRVAEQEYVTRSLGEFRDAAWAFVSGLRRSLSAEQTADRRIGHRMRRLESAVRSGDPARLKTEAQDTVSLLTEFLAERGTRHQAQLQEMAARLQGLRDELDSVRKQASVDPVTGIYNRASFDEQIEREIDLATLFGWRGCLILVDIDHFKWVNDTHGHPCGDEVLREVAETLTRCFMRRDDFVARYGGEEFAILLRDIELPVASDLADRGLAAIRYQEVPFAGLDEPVRVTVSMGVARLRQGETAASWIERADRSLYRAKENGRDRVELDPVDLDEA